MREPLSDGSRVASRDDFLAVYDRCAARVLAFHTRRVFDPEVARDLWAETFALAYEEWGKRRLRDRGGTEAWLFGIARNVLAHYYRRGSAEARALGRLGLERPELARGDIEAIAELADLRHQRERLMEALNQMPEGERAVLTMRFADERSYAEMAADLGLTEDAVRMRVSRGLRRLRKRLGGPSEGGVHAR
jgi:RNA polymerase sigma-70 factor (ECF subfamily)